MPVPEEGEVLVGVAERVVGEIRLEHRDGDFFAQVSRELRETGRRGILALLELGLHLEVGGNAQVENREHQQSHC